MSISSVLAATPAAPQSLYLNQQAIIQASRANTNSQTQSDGGSATVQGSSLFSALYQALTTFVKNNEASSASTSTSATSSAPAADSTSTAVSGSTAAATSSSSTPAATTASTGSGSSTSLGADLQSFLHDLFGALRQAGGHGFHPGGGAAPPVQTTANTSTTTTTPTATSTSTTAAATTASTVAANTAATTSSADEQTTVPVSSVTPTSTAPAAATTPATASSAAAGYVPAGNRGIINALKALIQDIGNSEVVGSTSTASGTPSTLSASAISDLSHAFAKLISDLGGSTSNATTTTGTSNSAGATSTTDSSSSTSSSSTSGTANAGTAALQTFLTSFLQDLQNGASTSTNSQGSLINTQA